MIKSMTGYGKAETRTENRKITVEIRSLNSKQLDLSMRVPSVYRMYEYEIRNRIAQVMQRGKVDVFVSVEYMAGTQGANINADLLRTYVDTLRNMSASFGLTGQHVDAAIFSSAMRMPDVVSSDDCAVSPQEQQALMEAVDQALVHIDSFRVQEGAALIADLLRRIDLIASYKQQVVPYEKDRLESIQSRIRDSIAALGVGVDENRLAQEMIFYVEKLDITEEKVRLDNHCKYFRQVAHEEEGVGRKLGFIAQEMGREINTLGSKANHSEIQILVVKMKDELEKIKEQVLNIL